MRRYGWIAVLLVILIVGFAAWNEWSRRRPRRARRPWATPSSRRWRNPIPASAAPRSTMLAEAEAQTGRGAGERVAVLHLLLAADSVERGQAEAALPALQQVAAKRDAAGQLPPARAAQAHDPRRRAADGRGTAGHADRARRAGAGLPARSRSSNWRC
jgi:predicted negative regulator of RcsB-dependent stress response